MVSADKAMVSVFQIGFKRDDSLRSQLLDLTLDVPNVASPRSQLFVDVCEELLG